MLQKTFKILYFSDLVFRSTRTTPEALGYCLDQLSFMIYRCHTLDHLILQHLVEKIEDIFMSSYLPDEDTNIPCSNRSSILELQMTDQFCLDKDSDEPIALSVGNLVLKVCYILCIFCLYLTQDISH